MAGRGPPIPEHAEPPLKRALCCADLKAARIRARTAAELAARGLTIGAHDLIIGDTALSNGYAVLTDNVREFGRVPGLEVR